MLLVEHESEGHSLNAADSQAFEYIQDLAHDSRKSLRFFI